VYRAVPGGWEACHWDAYRHARVQFQQTSDLFALHVQFEGVARRITDGRFLGETWVNHHGHHGVESTRGVLAPERKGIPSCAASGTAISLAPPTSIPLNLPLPGDSQPLVLGQVLSGMSPQDPPVANQKNDPMMPIAWTKTYSVVPGKEGAHSPPPWAPRAIC